MRRCQSRGNVINPDSIVQQNGVDAVRAYLMFIGPWEAGGPWNSRGIEGIVRFLKDVWNLSAAQNSGATVFDAEDIKLLKKTTHQTLKKVTQDYNQFKFNTAIAALMSFRNVMKELEQRTCATPVWDQALDTLLLMLAPITPHIAEELWQKRHAGNSIHLRQWPQFDEELAKEKLTTLVVQVNGKLRDRLEIPMDLEQSVVEEKVLSSPKIQPYVADHTIRKLIVIKNKLVNIVV
jgi:leucyl-tRNA synthetase